MSRRQRIVTWSAVTLLAAMVIVFLIALSLTETEYGKNQIRRYVQTWINGKVKGKIYVVPADVTALVKRYERDFTEHLRKNQAHGL